MQGTRYQSSKPQGQERRGGWRGSPASLAALAAHRPTWADVRRCPCGQPARAGRIWCRRCGPVPGSPCSPARAARRELGRLRKRGDLAHDLAQLDVFRRTCFARLHLAPFALGLVRAWPNRDTDPQGWASAVRAARQALSA